MSERYQTLTEKEKRALRLLVNGYDREPVAPSSVLAYVICRDLPGNESSAWLAALGAMADVGTPLRLSSGVRRATPLGRRQSRC